MRPTSWEALQTTSGSFANAPRPSPHLPDWLRSKSCAEVLMAPKLHPDFKEFLFSLMRHDVRFVVIGAHALALLGRPRYSDDLDVLVQASADNAERLAAALRSFGGFEELADAIPGHMSQPDRMFSLGRAPIAIDVTTGIDGVTFDEAWSGRDEHDVDGLAIPFIGKAEYIRTKRAANRPKDQADLALLAEAGLLDDEPGD